MERISIRTRSCVFDATFEAVRALNGYRLGWATVSDAERDFRFPAMIRDKFLNVWTVSDWDGPWKTLDLNDRFQLKEMLKTSQGFFYNPSTGKSAEGGPGQAIYGFVRRRATSTV